MLLAILCLVPLAASTYATHRQCLARSPQEFYNLLSLMTPYDTVRGNVKQLPGCKAKKLWYYQRHGTRFPSDSEIKNFNKLTTLRDNIVENHAQGRGELCSDDLEVLSKWSLVAYDEMSQNMLLTVTGMEELRKRGKRLYEDFRHLVRDKEQIEIKFTHCERTRQSAESVTLGLYGKPMKLPSSLAHDSIVQNERNCSAWKPSTNSSTYQRVNEQFINTPEMRKLISTVSQRLGFRTDLSLANIKDMYDTCRFEFSWYHDIKSSPWCAAFTTKDMELLEFWQDLGSYYKSGYGNELTEKLGCELIRDIIDKFSSGDKKATMYFGHSVTIGKLIVSLGIGYSEPLKADGYLTSKHRLWRTSYLKPFAANVMAVLYDCEGESDDTNEKLRIGVFLNEKLVRLPVCGGRETCGFVEFFEKYAPVIDPQTCNLDFCNAGK